MRTRGNRKRITDKGSALMTFNLGTSPTVVMDIEGSGDETIEIRPFQFFEYDADTYGLLYTTRLSATQGDRRIKLATATKSGFNHTWVKQGVVLAPASGGSWDEEIGGAGLVKNGSTWILVYDDFRHGQIGLASGTDLLSLTRNPSNPVIDNTASTGAFNRYLRHPNINIIGDTAYIHYEGRLSAPTTIINSNLGYASAPLSDLTDWTLHSEPVIRARDIKYSRGENDAVCNSNINFINGYYYFWWQAYPPQDTADPYEFGGTSYAYSKDLVNWTLVGTENYHIYMGLFGYNSSSDFYHTCQEVTPVWDGTNLSIYIYDLTSSAIGKIDLDGAAFVNEFRGFDVADNFDDNSIDTNKWTTGTGNGITVSETGKKLQIVCDGVGSESGDPVILSSDFSRNCDDGNIVCVFDLTQSNTTGGSDYFSCELSTSDRSTGIRLQRAATTNTIDIYVYVGGVLTLGRNFAFTGSRTFKILISKRNKIDIFVGNGNTFNHLTQWDSNPFTNVDLGFKVIANNSVGQTITIDNFAFGEYDSGLLETFRV